MSTRLNPYLGFRDNAREAMEPGTNHSVSLSGDDEAPLRDYWDKLSDGGNVVMPLEQAPWGDFFGMCVDRFGINWLVNISPAS